MTTLAEIQISRKDDVVTVRVADTLIDTGSDRDTILRRVDAVLADNGWVRVGGFSPADRADVAPDTLVAHAARA